MHGDEVGGWDAVRGWLRSLSGAPPARSLCVFIGNPKAAQHGVRHLHHQPDFNRVWQGGIDHPLAEAAHDVVSLMRRRGCFAAIDIHNNSGANPCHVCVAKLDWHTLRVASLFAPITVHVDHPKTIQTAAFANFCPAVTLEAGRVGDAQGVSRVRQMLDTLPGLESLDEIEVGDGRGVSLFRTLARIEFPDGCDFDFASFARDRRKPAASDITVNAELGRRNFETLAKGALFARASGDGSVPFVVTNAQGELDIDAFFDVGGGEVRLGREMVFSMFTTNCESVRRDCLCYIMEPIAPHRIGDA